MISIDCDLHDYHKGYDSVSCCKQCYFDYMSCEEDSHEVNECLNDPTCPNHKETVERLNHWDELDYHYKPKKGIVIKI